MSAFLLGYDIQDAKMNKKRGNAIDQLNARVRYAEPLAADYKVWLETKEAHVEQFKFEIYAEMRPDRIDPTKCSLEQKRFHNVKLVAWTEWWAETVKGGELLSAEKTPKLRGLSDAIMRADFQAAAASKALADIADRMEMATGMSNPRGWVEARAQQMYAKAQWEPQYPTVPVYSSLKPYPPVSDKRVNDSNNEFNPISHSLYGIQDMLLR